MLNDQLLAATEHLRQADSSGRALELVVLVDLHHRQPAPVRVQSVPLAGHFLLPDEEFLARNQPLLAAGYLWQAHCTLLLPRPGLARTGFLRCPRDERHSLRWTAAVTNFADGSVSLAGSF